MADFTLDTSGAVWVDPIDAPGIGWLWSDLTPFQQGYVEAMKRARRIARPEYLSNRRLDWRFSDLSPEALALILRDCAERLTQICWPDENTSQDGRDFWESRQRGFLIPGFRPLTVSLDDDGKAHLSGEAA